MASISPSEPSTSSVKSFHVIVNRKLVSLIGTVKKMNLITTYAEVLEGLKTYIMERKLYDPLFPVMIRCCGDELSSVLGVDQFTIYDVTKLLQKLVLPVRINRNNSAASAPSSLLSVSDNAAKRKNEESEDLRLVKKNCDQAPKDPMYLFIPPTPPHRMESSDTAESIQGYETAFVKDTTDDCLTYSEDSDNNLHPGDILAVEETFDLEYEIESDSDNEKDMYEPESGSDSECADDTVITFVCKSDSDQAFWADKSSDEEFDSDLEIPESDKWKCKRCGSLNNPPMRYCIKCWDMRTGWIAPKRGERRAPPKRKQRTKHYNKQSSRSSDEESSSSFNTVPSCSSSSAAELSSASTCSLSSLHKMSNLCFDSSSQEMVTSSCSSSQEFPSTSSCSSSHECSSSSRTSQDGTGSHKDKNSLRDVWTPNLSTVAKCDSEKKLCLLCCERPANASIIHGKYAHQISCYRCARKLQHENKRCPVCRRTIDRVVYQMSGL